jgi:hypothetical protein
VDGHFIRVRGWAAWRGNYFTQTLHVFPLPPQALLTLHAVARPDLVTALGPAYANSGFDATIHVPDDVDAASVARALCLVSRDASRPAQAVANPAGSAACLAACGH